MGKITDVEISGICSHHLAPNIPSEKLIPMILLVAVMKSKSIARPTHRCFLVLAPGDQGTTPKHVKGRKAVWVKGTQYVLLHLFPLPYLSFSFFFTSSRSFFPRQKNIKQLIHLQLTGGGRLNSKGCII